jgi:hypothetical protein
MEQTGTELLGIDYPYSGFSFGGSMGCSVVGGSFSLQAKFI